MGTQFLIEKIKNKRRLRRNGQGISLERAKILVQLCYFSAYNRIQTLSKVGSNPADHSSESLFYRCTVFFPKTKNISH